MIEKSGIECTFKWDSFLFRRIGSNSKIGDLCPGVADSSTLTTNSEICVAADISEKSGKSAKSEIYASKQNPDARKGGDL
jgi:hypothetical protein